MESAGLVLDALGRVREMVREAISDLTPQEIARTAQAAYRVAHLAHCAGAGCQFFRPPRTAAIMDHRSLA